MGIRQALRMREVVDEVTASLGSFDVEADPSQLPYATPWGQSDLQRIVYADVFGTTGPPITSRSAAMRLPAVARARNLLVSTISRLPLQVMRADQPIDPQPTWAYRTNQATSPQLRLAWTVDDLIFHGWSCWARQSNGSDGFPLMFDRVPFNSWRINADNRVEVDGQVKRDNEVTLIPGLHEGVLSYGLDTIADTRMLYSIVRQRLLNPVPQIDLHQTSGTPLTDPQIDVLIDRWSAARQGTNGGVGYSNQSIEVKELGGGGDSQLMIEARNAASLDLARLVGITAGLIDATAPKASLNYETATGRNQEFVDFDLALYLTPITARLSLDDIVPAGQRVAFDLSDLTNATPAPTGPTIED